jgi:hypothetical protein
MEHPDVGVAVLVWLTCTCSIPISLGSMVTGRPTAHFLTKTSGKTPIMHANHMTSTCHIAKANLYVSIDLCVKALAGRCRHPCMVRGGKWRKA